MKPLLEKDITRQIRSYLDFRSVWHWKVWQGLGSKPGVADIIGIFKGRPMAIEVKTEKGKVSEAQAAFLDRFKREGGIAFVARGIDDVAKHLFGEAA